MADLQKKLKEFEAANKKLETSKKVAEEKRAKLVKDLDLQIEEYDSEISLNKARIKKVEKLIKQSEELLLMLDSDDFGSAKKNKKKEKETVEETEEKIEEQVSLDEVLTDGEPEQNEVIEETKDEPVNNQQNNNGGLFHRGWQ